jgi:hypothetical protein
MPIIACYPKRVPKIIENVLIRLHPEKMHKRRRRIIRIPRNVYLRVRAKLVQG